MGETDIFAILARFLPPTVKPAVITWLRNEATVLTIYSLPECCNEKLLEVSLPRSGSKGSAQGSSPSSPG